MTYYSTALGNHLSNLFNPVVTGNTATTLTNIQIGNALQLQHMIVH